MKYLTIILIFSLAAGLAFSKTIKEGDTEYSCQPKKTCDQELKAARNKIRQLTELLKEEQEKVMFLSQVQEKEVVTEKIVEVVKEKQVIKKHIVSVLAHKTTEEMKVDKGNNYATIESSTVYIPAVTYQYQFDVGLTPMIGVDLYKNTGLLIGLGWEF